MTRGQKLRSQVLTGTAPERGPFKGPLCFKRAANSTQRSGHPHFIGNYNMRSESLGVTLDRAFSLTTRACSIATALQHHQRRADVRRGREPDRLATATREFADSVETAKASLSPALLTSIKKSAGNADNRAARLMLRARSCGTATTTSF